MSLQVILVGQVTAPLLRPMKITGRKIRPVILWIKKMQARWALKNKMSLQWKVSPCWSSRGDICQPYSTFLYHFDWLIPGHRVLGGVYRHRDPQLANAWLLRPWAWPRHLPGHSMVLLGSVRSGRQGHPGEPRYFPLKGLRRCHGRLLSRNSWMPQARPCRLLPGWLDLP